MSDSTRTRALQRLPGLTRGEDEPVFRDAWEAEAFALVIELHAAGRFTWPQWSSTLAAEISAAQTQGDADLGDTYYHHWLAALERLCAEGRLVTREEAAARKEAWRRAYVETPHGQPVELPRDPATRLDLRSS